MGEFVFFDWNATAPLAPESLAAMVEAAGVAGANPSSVHRAGRLARRILEDLREELARTLEASPRDVVLTGSGTEANNIAVRAPFVEGHGVLVTSRLEHPSVTRVAEALEREGRAQVHWARVSASGTIDVDDVRACLARGGVRLVALQAVNQETGVAQPLEVVHAECMNIGVPLHVDAVQAFGRTASPLLGTTRTVAAHKLRGPKGIGALVGSCGHRLHPVLLGGAQEKGLRPGTLDPMAAAGFLAALRSVSACQAGFEAQRARRDRLEAAVLALFPGSTVNGDTPSRLAHVSNIALAGLAGAEAVVALDLEGVGVSSGSACSAGTLEPSPVIAAMHDEARARRSIRMSLGPTTTDDHVSLAIAAFERLAARMKR
jgi:cysteine desulfurase